MKNVFRLGTRSSPLAIIQAEIARDLLQARHALLREEWKIEIVPIRTSGDWQPNARDITFLESGGNKGFFTKEIEEALLEGAIDVAVHSMKDVPNAIPAGLEFVAMLERADPRDAFISAIAPTLEELPSRSRVGTSSLRRKIQIKARRPDLKIVPLRGNIGTRMQKIADGMADATLLAAAGLQRLGMMAHASTIMDTKVMLPAAGQGVIGLEIRSNDDVAREFVSAVDVPQTHVCVQAERLILQLLDGSCRTPVAALAKLSSDNRLVTIEGFAARIDGSQLTRCKDCVAVGDAAKLAMAIGEELKLSIR